MASNNYVEVITDSTRARQILSDFQDMAARGCRFRVMQFNPHVDCFAISCGRISNFPTHPDVEAGGTTMEGADAAAVWNTNRDTLKAVDFGNGYFGLFGESEGQHYISVRDGAPADVSECRQCDIWVQSADQQEQSAPHVCPSYMFLNPEGARPSRTRHRE